MASSSIEVTRDDFAEKVLRAPNLVVVNFSSEQSDACKIQNPEFDAISKEYAEDKVTFARVNVTGQNDFTTQLRVDSIPTLIFFKNGVEIHRITGVVMRNKLRRQIEGVLLVN